MVLQFYPISGKIPYYPENSLRQIKGIWDNYFLDIAQKKVCICEIEHDILRAFRDPRVHFVVVPASLSGAKLANHAYTGQDIDFDLDKAKNEFLNNNDNFRVDMTTKTIYLSRIFKWFPLDFAIKSGLDITHFPPPSDKEIIISYIKSNGSTEIQKILKSLTNDFKVDFLKFNWGLNDIKVKQASF